jgi:hypothetical protein
MWHITVPAIIILLRFGVEPREVLTDDVVRGVALDSLGSGFPGSDSVHPHQA